jgi:hypothetical protein
MSHKNIQFLLFVLLLRPLYCCPRQCAEELADEDFPLSPPSTKKTGEEMRNNSSVDADETGVSKVCIGGSCTLGQHVSNRSPLACGGKKTTASRHLAAKTNG